MNNDQSRDDDEAQAAPDQPAFAVWLLCAAVWCALMWLMLARRK